MSAAAEAIGPLDRPIAITFFRDEYATTKQEAALTPRLLAQRIVETWRAKKGELPWLKLARFGEVKTVKGSLRHDANVLAVSGCEADYDAELTPMAAAVELLTKQGIACIVYTSPSATADRHRWRVLCPFSAELPPRERERMLGRLNGLLGGIFSVESFTLSQSYYFGGIAGNEAHRVELVDGLPLDLHDDLDEVWRGKPATESSAAAGTQSGPLDVAALLREIVEAANYHGAMIRLAGYWSTQGVSYAEVHKRLSEAMETIPEPERDERWQKRFADIDRVLSWVFGKRIKEEARPKQGSRRDDDGPPEYHRPLHRELPPAPTFPIEALGELRPAAEAIHLLTQAPMAICAQSVLAAATLAVQAHYDVELPGVGRRPLTAIYASVAESGERKTSVDRRALRPVHEAERRWGEAAATEMATYAADKAAYEAVVKRIKADRNADRGAIRARIIELGPEPKPPPRPMLLVADPTPEALVLHLAEGRPWGGLFCAEGGLLIGGSAFNDESRMRTGALLNALWDGEAVRRSRVVTGQTFLPGRRCTAHVMMQPTVAADLFGDAMLDGIGTLARVLLIAPESTAGTRLYREPDASVSRLLDEYGTRLTALLDRKPRTRDGDPDALDPIPLPLSSDARRMWIAFHDKVEVAQRQDGPLASVRAFASKMPEHAGRLAAVLMAYAAPDAVNVSAEAMAAGTMLAQHYAAELGRLLGAAALGPDLRLAQRLLAWWQARLSPRCHLAEIYQTGPRPIRDAATARRITDILEGHGWVRALKPGIELDGVPRREAWELLP